MTNEKPTADLRFESSGLGCPFWVAPSLALIGAAIAFSGQSELPGWNHVAAITLAISGLIVVGTAIAKTPNNLLNMLSGCVVAALSVAATHESWESARLLFAVLAGAGAFAIVVLLLPRPFRMAVVSLMAVFHFLGVLSAITSPPPQSWLSNWTWVTLFRPHLVFCYTNNAYQFYSPEPGPASLLWFCIETTNGEKLWFKMPRKPETHLDPMSVEFYRRLSMTEAINQNQTLAAVPTDVLQSRLNLVNLIPLLPDTPATFQYRPPQPHVRRILSSYVRHVTGLPNFQGQVSTVKVYRVLHKMLTAQEFAEGRNPFGESTYMPYYLGTFDAQGQLLDPDDPMLYWLLPITRRPVTVTPNMRPGIESVDNFLSKHAGSDPFEDRQGTKR